MDKKAKTEIKELGELKKFFKKDEKQSKFDKIFQSDKIDSIIDKLQQIYSKISEKLLIKFELKNELKQGKIFTILIVIMIFVFISLVFLLLLPSLISLNFLFSLLKYSLFFIRWGYMIIKSKGNLILKYLSNLFPNSKILSEEVIKKNNDDIILPVFEKCILKDVNELLLKLDNSNLKVEDKRNLAIKLKEIVLMLHLEDLSFESEIQNLEYKKEVSGKIKEVELILERLMLENRKEEMFSNLTNFTTLKIDNYLETSSQEKVKVKTKRI